MIAMSASAALVCLGLLLTLAMSAGWLAPAAFLLVSVALMNWQMLHWLPREIGPLLDRSYRESGRDPRAGFGYRWMLGKPAIVWSNLALLASIALVLYKDGRFG
ncbi:hypothetical protein D3C71_1951300 [compost metagenome]